MTPIHESAPLVRAGFARALVPAAGLVAGIYVFFLIFAQFGFVHGLRGAGMSVEAIHRTLGVMALAGIITSVLSVVIMRRVQARYVGTFGLLTASLAGGLAGLGFHAAGFGTPLFVLVAVLTGVGLGAATVAAAVLLRAFTGGRALGLHVGAGTGLAYLVCNIPGIFDAAPATKGWFGAAAALGGAVAAWAGRTRLEVRDGSRYRALGRREAVGLATVAFLGLVWFDSAAFTVVQSSTQLRSAHWGAPQVLWMIGATHVLAAIAAGVALDRGRFEMVLASALVLLVAGHLGFSGSAEFWPGMVYAAGVSLYSTALAAFAALGPAQAGLPPAARAASVYSVSGWMGSVAGIGLAETFGHVPAWAAPVAGVLLAGVLVRLRAVLA